MQLCPRGGVWFLGAMGIAVASVLTQSLPKEDTEASAIATVHEYTRLHESFCLWRISTLVLETDTHGRCCSRILPNNLRSNSLLLSLIYSGPAGSLFLFWNYLQHWSLSLWATDRTSIPPEFCWLPTHVFWRLCDSSPGYHADLGRIQLVPWCHGSGLHNLCRESKNLGWWGLGSIRAHSVEWLVWWSILSAPYTMDWPYLPSCFWGHWKDICLHASLFHIV